MAFFLSLFMLSLHVSSPLFFSGFRSLDKEIERRLQRGEIDAALGEIKFVLHSCDYNTLFLPEFSNSIMILVLVLSGALVAV